MEANWKLRTLQSARILASFSLPVLLLLHALAWDSVNLSYHRATYDRWHYWMDGAPYLSAAFVFGTVCAFWRFGSIRVGLAALGIGMLPIIYILAVLLI